MRQTFQFLAILILGTSLMTGCQTSTSPSSTNSTPVNPKAGTVYKTKNVHKDSTGTVVSQDTTTETVTAAGLSYGGYTNVYHITSTSTRSSSVTDIYVHRETNGDLSIMGSSNMWQVVPFGSQATLTTTQDTTISGTTLHEVVTYSGAGSGSFSVNGNSFTTQKAMQTATVTGLALGAVTQTGTIEFAPALGWVVVVDQPGTRDPFSGVMSSSSHSEMYSYTLVQ